MSSVTNESDGTFAQRLCNGINQSDLFSAAVFQAGSQHVIAVTGAIDFNIFIYDTTARLVLKKSVDSRDGYGKVAELLMSFAGIELDSNLEFVADRR